MSNVFFIHPIVLLDYGSVDSIRNSQSILKSLARRPDSRIKIFSANRKNALIGVPDLDFSEDSFETALDLLRRNAASVWSLVVKDKHSSASSAFAKLLFFENGDACIVLALADADEALASYAMASDLFKKLFLPDLKKQSEQFIQTIRLKNGQELKPDFETPTHTLISSIEPCEQAVRLFAGEGLEFNDQATKLGAKDEIVFFAGWSTTAINSSRIDLTFFCAVVMVRLQLDWLAIRRMRAVALDTAMVDVGRSRFRNLLDRDFLIGEQIFYIQWREQRSREFHANLKPWLGRAASSVQKMWDVRSDYDSVRSTLLDARDYTGSYLRRKSAIQERLQSTLLYAIAALDILAFTSILVSLKQISDTNNYLQKFVIDFFGSSFILYVLAFNAALFLIVLLIGIYNRFFR